MAKHTHKGHCQACGRIQAVTGRWLYQTRIIAKHGYKVKHGYFSGVCIGSKHQPMEKQSVLTLQRIAFCEQDAVECEEYAVSLESGDKKPVNVKTGHKFDTVTRKYVDVKVTWADANEYQRREEVRRCIWSARNRAEYMRRAAKELNTLLGMVFGRELIPNKE